MNTPLLATKLFIPPTSNRRVTRNRLLEKLDGCLKPECRLTVISAPAGFGKTTLASAWAESHTSQDSHSPACVAWLSLEEADNDPLQFWTYVIFTIQKQHEGTGSQALSLLQATQSPELEQYLVSLVNDLSEISGTLILVLDDYHLIHTPAVHQSLDWLIEHAPLQFHLLLLSRTDPSLPLARLRSRGQLLEIRLDELRFTPEETETYLNEGMHLDLQLEDIQTLQRKTEGWIAGIQMAGLSMQGRPDTAEFIQTFSGSNRYILDYLLEEILNHQPENITKFLLETSILSKLTAPLCDAVRGSTNDSQALLEDLERLNLFIIPLDEDRRWYRYHHLFADLLSIRLQQAKAVPVSELHLRASSWFEANGMIALAVQHALAARDFERAAHLAEKNAPRMLVRDELNPLLSWITSLPPLELQRHALLRVYQAWAITLTGDIEQAELVLKDLGAQMKDIESGRTMEEVQNLITLDLAYIDIQRGKVIQGFDKINDLGSRWQINDLSLRSAVTLLVGSVHATIGDLESAIQAHKEVVRLSREVNDIPSALRGIYELGALFQIQGRLNQAAEIYQMAREFTALETKVENQSLGVVNISLAELLYERDDLQEAFQYIRRGLEHTQTWGGASALVAGYDAQSRILLAMNDLEGARKALAKARQVLQIRADFPIPTSFYDSNQMRVWLREGDLPSAERWAQAHPEVASETWTKRFNYIHEVDYLTYTRVLIAENQIDEAAEVLAWLAQAAQDGQRFGRLISASNLQAICLQRLGKTSEALQALATSLTHASSEGYVRTFLEEGEAMAHLLRAAARSGIYPDYSSRLLAVFQGLPPNSPSSAQKAIRREEMVAALSERELEVLKLIAEGMTNQEIAHRLYISLRTVKYHTTNIYTKLMVNGRAQAALKARELGLL